MKSDRVSQKFAHLRLIDNWQSPWRSRLERLRSCKHGTLAWRNAAGCRICARVGQLIHFPLAEQNRRCVFGCFGNIMGSVRFPDEGGFAGAAVWFDALLNAVRLSEMIANSGSFASFQLISRLSGLPNFATQTRRTLAPVTHPADRLAHAPPARRALRSNGFGRTGGWWGAR